MLLDLIGLLGTAVCVLGLNGSIAAYEGFAMSQLWWGVGYAGFLGLSLYAIFSTVGSALEGMQVATLEFARSGRGEELLDVPDRMKQCAALALLAHLVEIDAWLGIAENE
jgi:hypothetical protein